MAVSLRMCRWLEYPICRHQTHTHQGFPSQCSAMACMGGSHAVCSPGPLTMCMQACKQKRQGIFWAKRKQCFYRCLQAKHHSRQSLGHSCDTFHAYAGRIARQTPASLRFEEMHGAGTVQQDACHSNTTLSACKCAAFASVGISTAAPDAKVTALFERYRWEGFTFANCNLPFSADMINTHSPRLRIVACKLSLASLC